MLSMVIEVSAMLVASTTWDRVRLRCRGRVRIRVRVEG